MTSNGQVLVLGGSGFLGSHVADQLSEAGYSVVIYDRVRSPYLRADQHMIEGSILDNDRLYDAAKGCDYIYNFAAIADIGDAHQDPIRTTQINILGNTYALDAAQRAGAKRFILASTIYVYSASGSFYRVSKQAAEKMTEAYYEATGLEYTILRYGSLYGRRTNEKNSIYSYLKNAITTGSIQYGGSKHAVREYIHVLDAAKQSVEVLKPEYKNKNMVLTGQEKLGVEQLFTMISEMMPNPITISFENNKNFGHYDMTPYKYQPSIGEKMIPNQTIDLGQGLLDTITSIYEEQEVIV
jgi:UDP-glucose 4-epimerase